MTTLILASGSDIRAKLLQNAGLKINVQVAKVDEDAIKQSLLAEDTQPRDIADSLARAISPIAWPRPKRAGFLPDIRATWFLAVIRFWNLTGS